MEPNSKAKIHKYKNGQQTEVSCMAHKKEGQQKLNARIYMLFLSSLTFGSMQRT
jgi:hypothetical protein